MDFLMVGLSCLSLFWRSFNIFSSGLLGYCHISIIGGPGPVSPRVYAYACNAISLESCILWITVVVHAYKPLHTRALLTATMQNWLANCIQYNTIHYPSRLTPRVTVHAAGPDVSSTRYTRMDSVEKGNLFRYRKNCKNKKYGRFIVIEGTL